MKVWTLMVCAGLLLVWGASASAQQGTPQKTNPLDRAARHDAVRSDTLTIPPMSEPEAVADSGARKVAGKIVSVDSAAKMITIVMRHRKVEKTFAVDPYATIMAGGKEVELGDLQPGKKVTLIYWTKSDGNVVIAIRSAP